MASLRYEALISKSPAPGEIFNILYQSLPCEEDMVCLSVYIVAAAAAASASAAASAATAATASSLSLNLETEPCV
jgi:hypothetical protein